MLSRGTYAILNHMSHLQSLHNELGHSRAARLFHFIKTQNLSFLVEELRSVNKSCPICMECKLQFYRTDKATLIKATKPFECLSLDFKGPLPSNNRNVYFLDVIDEYSRFPFAILCSDVSAPTVIKCLQPIFSIFGYPNYIYTDRGAAVMSTEVQQYLHERGIATSRTTSYNPRGNGQVERENATIWKTVLLTLKAKDLPVTRWQEVLPEALHSIRSLLCTATNMTPHDHIFSFIRKAMTGTVLTKWMMTPGPVLLWKHCRPHKADPLVDQVELRHVNPQYAFVTFPDGREDSVATRDLAQAGCVNNVEETLMSTDQQGAQQQSLEQSSIESPQRTMPPTPEIRTLGMPAPQIITTLDLMAGPNPIQEDPQPTSPHGHLVLPTPTPPPRKAERKTALPTLIPLPRSRRPWKPRKNLDL
ncbi:uncharacterized protein [Narcine bancroftii]|uniref:uncharacterized protein n=1 Tax=Narcine bancroftii TaxID=1343680 RepID=UPI0038318058